MKTDVNVKTNPTQRGQGMMEYIIIVAMIAVAAIGTYSLFGQTIRTQTAGMAREIAGQNAGEQISKAGDDSNAAVGRATATKGMSTYNVENDQGAAK
jgi:Flp pilus assembly pilin Flp